MFSRISKQKTNREDISGCVKIKGFLRNER